VELTRLPIQLTIIGLIVSTLLGILSLIPGYLALGDNRGPERTSASPPGATSLRQPSGQAALRLDAAHNRTRESIIWALGRPLVPEDDPIIQASNLAGNDSAQNKITALLVQRGGVKVETDETEDYRPHSQVRLVVTGQHERPVLITGLHANVVRRERPLSDTIVWGPPKARARTFRWG
jgi:hypothetical protein